MNCCETSGRRGISLLRICMIIMLMMMVVCGGLVTYVVVNFKRWTAALMRGPLVTMVKSSDLPADQRDALTGIFNRLTDDFEAGRISYTQLGMVAGRLMEGPLPDLMIIEAVQSRYVEMAFPAEESAPALRTFARLQRGICEQTVPAAELREVMSLVSVDDGSGRRTVMENLTRTQLKAFMAAAQETVDRHGVPDEDYRPDYAGQVRRVVTAVLGEQAVPATAEAPATQPDSTEPGPESPEPGPEAPEESDSQAAGTGSPSGGSTRL